MTKDYMDKEGLLLEFVREVAHCGIARLEGRAREVLDFIGEDY